MPPFRANVMACLSICVLVSFIFLWIINVLPISSDSCEKYHESHNSIQCNTATQQTYLDSLSNPNFKKKKLAIIVPFRERFEELMHFAPYMHTFLSIQKIPHHIFVINQVDRYRFNRASLINVGFLFTKDEFDYICMHDVDLLPVNKDIKYDYPTKGPFHVAAPGLHPKYNYPTFIGGILLLKKEDYELVNGMSNKYWGWGLEDDEFYVRLKDAGLKIYRPENIKTDMTSTFDHIHDRAHRKRDTVKCHNQKEETRKRDRQTGLDTIKYAISEKRELTIDSVRVTVLNVKLECDKSLTPWCDCSDLAKPKVKRGL